MPINNTYGEAYTIASEVELGTLYYMACNGLVNLSVKEREELKLYKEARNELAHLVCLENSVMEELFGE